MRTEEFRRFRNPVIATMLSRRLGEPAVKEKIRSVFDRLSESMKRQDDLGHRALVQGDMSPKNLYVFDNGEVEFLDFEWAGYTGSRALAEVIDLGNLRARSWNNSEFQNALDEAYRNLYSEKGEEFLGKAIVALAILRSSILLIGFFENYSGDRRDMPEETQKRNVIENDIARILAMDI